MENRNRQVLLKRRPTGAPTPDDFTIADAPLPDPAEGEVLVRGIYLSLDPYMRGRISGQRSYARPVDVGAVMEGRVVGEVARSRDPGYREGDYVLGGFGWQLYSAVPGQGLLKLDPAEAPLSTALGVLGMPGLTAYVGLDEIGKPQRGETVVISAASGAVGAVVGQLAKRAGARVVGIAGGPDKCRWVEAELGFETCIDHRSADLGAALDHACPNGIDVYWENVGGAQAAQDPGVHRRRPVAAFCRVPGDGGTAVEERRAQISRGHRRGSRPGARGVYRAAAGPQFRQARRQARRGPEPVLSAQPGRPRCAGLGSSQPQRC